MDMATTNWGLNPNAIANTNVTTLVSFDPHDIDNVDHYYDYEADCAEQLVTAFDPRLDNNQLSFFSSQAPDPLYIDIDTGVLYDMDSQVVLGDVTDITLGTTLDPELVEHNTELLESIIEDPTNFEAFPEISDPRILETHIFSADSSDDPRPIIFITTVRTGTNIDDGDDLDTTPYRTPQACLGAGGVLTELSHAYANALDTTPEDALKAITDDFSINTDFDDYPNEVTFSGRLPLTID
jgi:hypothetical protein